MPIFYTCKRCKKNYSKNQYDKRVFCRICGSLLLSQFVIDPEIKEGLNESLFIKKKSIKKKLSFNSTENHFLKRAANNLNNKVKNRKEYSVFSQKKVQKKPDVKEKESYLFNCEYEDALSLKKKLLKKFEKKPLEQAIPGKITSNIHGEYYSI